MRSSSNGILKNRSIVRAAGQLVEQLEGRRMMAADPFDFHNDRGFVVTSSNIYDTKNGALAKGGAALASLYAEYNKFVKRGGNRYQFNSSQADVYNIKGRDIMLTLRTRGNFDQLVADIKEMGGSIIYRSKGKRTLDAFVPLNQVANLASRPEILHLRPQRRPTLNSVGSVGNDAERSEKTQFVLPAFGVDGTGVTVGALSDSFGQGSKFDFNNNGVYDLPEDYLGNQSVLTGDLPTDVNVLEDGTDPITDTDEGRAMLELVHDLAPGADLQFATAFGGINKFAANIRALREAGSDVLVDDVLYFDEPFFGEGVIDRAINDVVDDGATYFSAQGNFGFAGYSATTDWTKETKEGGLAVDFDKGAGVDTRLDIHFNRASSPSAPIYLQWDNPYDGVVADISADVDVFLYRDGTLVSSSTDDNFATGAPIEVLNVPEGGDYEMVIRLATLEKGATAPTMFKFLAPDDGLFDSRKDVEFPGYHTSTFGHTSATNNIPVGAVDNAASNAFGTTSELVSQDFSSAGPSVHVFDANGNRLTTPTVVLTPVVSGIQGTNTSIRRFAPFFGTSAAAPNVAAIAALLKQMTPTATADDIKEALITSAKTNPVNGQKPGVYDSQAGYGLVDALKAASLFKPTVAVSDFAIPIINAGGAIDSAVINFNVPVTGVDIDDFVLNRDSTKTGRFSGSETITSSDGGKTYTINNLRAATTTLGVYTLTLRSGRTGITDIDGNPAAGNVVSFSITLARPSNLLADTLDDGDIRLRWTDTNRGEDGYRVQRSTDVGFKDNVRNFDLDANTSSFTDTSTEPGEEYFYRIRAQKGSRFGELARTSAVASSTGEIFVDDRSAKLKGSWVKSADSSAFLQTTTRASETDILSATSNTATFASDSVAKGFYFVYTQYTANKRNATNANFQILLNGKLLQNVYVNETRRGNGWVLLGKFLSPSTGGLSVRLNSAGANGTVIADAIRFLPADEVTVENFEALKASKSKARAAAIEGLV